MSNALSNLDAAPVRRGSKRQHIAAPVARIDLLAMLVPNDPKARALVRAEAAKRDLTVPQLVRRVVETMIADRLFAAVLDDADDGGRYTAPTPSQERRP